MRIAIVGAGYVGAVTAACLAHLGHDVVCHDTSVDRVAQLSAGHAPVHELGLDELMRDGLEAGRLRFSAHGAAIVGSELVIVCVGTLDAAEDWTGGIVRDAVLGLAADGAAPRSIVVRSTLLPGTAVALAREARALDPAVRLAHNPEFTREATAVADFLAPDRVVIGVDGHDDGDAGTALAEAISRVYAPLDAPTVVTDLTTAETIKLASNVFLAAKIAFANELARLAAATGADVQAVVDGMGLDKRIGRSFLSPGPGFGGSCFPSQARALPDVARAHAVPTPLIDAIWSSNLAHTEWLLDVAREAVGGSLAGRRVALLGLTFKAGTDDLRESPALRLGEGLVARGAHVVAYDPMALEAGVARLRVGAAAATGGSVEAAGSAALACAGADAVVVATEWPDFATLDWSAIAPGMLGRVVIDSRRVVDAAAVRAAGLRLVGLGLPVDGLAPVAHA